MGGTVMAGYRYTMIFQYISGITLGAGLNLKGGWSESVYRSSFSPQLLTAFQGLAQTRAALLPIGAFISGLRVQQVDPSGASQTYAASYGNPSGVNGPQQDIPQMALLLKARSNSTNNVRNMRIAAVPDNQVTAGEFVPTQSYQFAMAFWFTAMSNWSMRAQDLGQPTGKIATVSSVGLVTLNTAVAITAGTLVKVKRTVDAFQNVKGGTYLATAVTVSTVQLQGWQWGSCTGGTIQPFVIVYPTMTLNWNSVARIVTRKIGRPSLGYRGRRSKRRP
jgi:hypothetical protein